MPIITGTTPFADLTQVSIAGPDGAEDCYTTDNSESSASNTLYSAPFSMTATANEKAIAIKNGVSSSVAIKAFTKNSGGNTGCDDSPSLVYRAVIRFTHPRFVPNSIQPPPLR